MAIISVNKNKSIGHYSNTQLRYATVYVLITFVVLLFLNIYTAETNQEMFWRSKEATLVEKCLLAASEISDAEVLNQSTVAEAIDKLGNLKVSRLMVTDHSGYVIYDTNPISSVGRYAMLPEILQALEMNDVFSWYYHDGTMISRAATPILSYQTLTGCVYMVENDPQQGILIKTLQNNTLSVTLMLEVFVILFSVTFYNRFSRRLKRIRTSMRIIRGGDYSHKVSMGGRDELTLLGDEFNDLTERLQTSENKRRQFVSDASHELKTPLASIKLLSDSILQNDMDMDTVKEFVSDIGNEAERLNRMTLKLLSLTKSEVPEEGVSEIIHIKPTIERVTRMLSAIAANNKIQIVLDIQQDLPILILEDDLYQIIFNLVENGIKYNVAGGLLTISLLRDEEDAVICFADTGVGVPEEAIPHLFERFYRVDKARSRKSGGSGLGLAIVRSLVERNNGTIEVQSTLDEGSVFTIRFPIFDTEEEEQ